jgi:D-lactate dehydrogenase (quinone)
MSHHATRDSNRMNIAMLTTPAPIAGDALLAQLRAVVGDANVLTDPRRNRRFRKGYRYGEGRVLAVVRPGSLVEQWRVFKAAVEAGRIVIINAANTGLNGGSTPFGDDYDREVVVINTLRINRIDLIEGGKQVLAQAGATLHALEKLIRPLGREPHSVIGSTTIGASIVGGVCNNSGGALLRRGPAFTQLALYARVDENGNVSLVNHLGIDLGNDPEEILGRLDRGDYKPGDIWHDTGKLASDPDYSTLVRDIEAPGPARFNNDPRLLYEASGSAGKLCVFAVRLDTFPSSGPSRVFYIGSNDYMELTNIRRHILSTFKTLPVAGEYLHRDAYTLAETYGKDLYLLIKHAGTERIPTAFAMKSRFDSITARLGLGGNLSDKILQVINRILPNHLPQRMNAFRDRYQHHLLLRMDGEGIEEARAYLGSLFPTANGDFFECDEEEALAAFRNRYAVGGGSVRYRAVHSDRVENIVALDLALPRNTIDWRETLPEGIEASIERRIPCGHFFCQVFHYDYAVKKGTDWLAIEHQIIAHLNGRGIEFPSEHNVGHLYTAKPVLADFYRSLDPTNTMNPGLGQTSKRKNWA